MFVVLVSSMVHHLHVRKCLRTFKAETVSDQWNGSIQLISRLMD